MDDNSMLPGFRFSPSRAELVKFLYIVTNGGGRLPACIPIKEYMDVYEEDRIWDLMEDKEEFYCLTKLKNKTMKSSRINRATQRGTWKGQSDEKILDGRNHIGSRRNFSFVPKKGFHMKNRMVMHEYRLDGDFKTLHSGFVIVHIKTYPKRGTGTNHEEKEHQRDERATPDRQHREEQGLFLPIQPSQRHGEEDNPMDTTCVVGLDWEEEDVEQLLADIDN